MQSQVSHVSHVSGHSVARHRTTHRPSLFYRRIGRSVCVGVFSFALVAGMAGPVQALDPIVLPASPAGATDLIGDLGARPGATSTGISVTDQVSASVDVGTGNLLTAVNLVSLPGINGDISISLAHNSLNPVAAVRARSAAGR